MELQTVDGRLRLSGAFKLAAMGYAIGAAAIFVPIFTLVIFLEIVSGSPMTMNGEVVEGGGRFFFALIPLVMVPVIVLMQSLIIGGMVTLGLWLYQTRKPIRVLEEEVATSPARSPSGAQPGIRRR